ncbi:uncharacterized protein CBL_02857 [Carabus blaptoides fortunei]
MVLQDRIGRKAMASGSLLLSGIFTYATSYILFSYSNIAKLFMEKLETTALETAELKPKVWLRYVDDTFVVWPHGREKLNEFLEHLDKQHPAINFTMEVEKDNKLPFLDVLVEKKEDKSLGHTVYSKKTHTNRYLHAQSHHHPAQFHSVARTLIPHRKIETMLRNPKTKIPLETEEVYEIPCFNCEKSYIGQSNRRIEPFPRHRHNIDFDNTRTTQEQFPEDDRWDSADTSK